MTGPTRLEKADSEIENQDEPEQPRPFSPPRGLPGGPAESQYQPKTLQFWLIILCNFLSLLLVALDRTIIATAIPRITDEFHSLGDIGWYGSAYMLASASAQLLFGRIYKFYNMKWVFLSSVLLFEIGSAICGAAPTSNAFIAGRAIAGFASAGIFSGCMLIIILMVPLHKRPMYQGLFGAVFGIASVMGPLVGGAFTTSVTWRWCFYINLPIGGAGLVAMTWIWHPPKVQHESGPILMQIKRLDPLGMIFFIPAMVCLLLAFQWGGSTYAWSSGRIIALFTMFGILILIFAAIQVWKPETATIPARVITQRSIFRAAVFLFFTSSSMIMMIYYVPIWFQTVKLVNPVKSGIYTLPLVLSLVVASFIGGLATQKIGYYVPVMYIGPSLMAIGLGLMTTFDLNTGSSHWIGYQFLFGSGLGLTMQITGLVVQRILPPQDISIGTALMFFVQQIGGSIFATVGQTILSNILGSHLSGIPGLDTALVVNQGATNLGSVVPSRDIVVVQRAYNDACRRIFFTALGLIFVSLISACGMEWKSIKKGKNGQGGPEHAEDSNDAGKSDESSQPLPKRTERS
ncbi:hypothetical protein N7520_000932 [Penicillium odoratum]|uniref:uncharacterized protein n=1 Tax=Penicillium odoratum TaxID=1167516 RepID=UPI002548C304|nr:uncharacterized protein N7520_000932 [Penicillium odoratum]KAJ5777686.1 hypothetical protein N7520_000932 [Penicillium odoratum]